jgi:segregation and condensation protein B
MTETHAMKQPPDNPTGASLDDLVAALGGKSADSQPQAGGDAVELSEQLPMDPEDDLSAVEGEASPRLVSIIESLLFAADRPLTVKGIRKILKEPSSRQVQLALKQIGKDTEDRGIGLTQVAGGYRLRTNPNNAHWVQRMLAARPAKLSRAQLETLAVVAYRQPITKAEVDGVRGVDCTAVLKILLERDVIQIVGRKEEPGRPLLYGTTVRFLEFFNLKSLRDMPDLRDLEELTEESRATLRHRFGDHEAESIEEAMGQGVIEFSDGGAAAEDEAGPAEAPDAESAEPAEPESEPAEPEDGQT